MAPLKWHTTKLIILMRFRWQNGGLMTSCVLIKSFGFQVWFDFWELFLSTVLIPTFNLLTCFAVATSKTLWCSLLEWKWSTSGELDNWIVLIFIFCNELCWQPMANQTRADYKKVTKKWNECLENWPFALKVKFNRLNLATMFWFCSHMCSSTSTTRGSVKRYRLKMCPAPHIAKLALLLQTWTHHIQVMLVALPNNVSII